MITVARQLPRNSRISAAVRPAAIRASRSTPEIAARTNTDWSNRARMVMSGGSSFDALGSVCFSCSTMRSVEAEPVLMIDISTPRAPSRRTILVCGEKPSRTWAISPR